MLAELAEGAGLYQPKDDPQDAEPQVDRAEELRVKWGVESGQLWRLPSRTPGQEHRLICGDASVPTTVKRLDCGDVTVLLTDPPYSSGGFQESQRKSGSIGNRQNTKIAADQLSTRGYISLMSEVLALVPADVLYMFTDWRMWSWTYDIAERANFPVRNMLVWDKGRMGMGFPWRSTHELILFAKRTPSKMMDGKTGNVLRFDRASNDEHPTEKPVELVQHILENTPDGVVYDPFGGAGTTMIACENLGRACRMVEISPGYVAVALERYATAFGIEPELIT
jgi:DNA modification methylase